MHLAILLPAYNEERAIAGVLSAIPRTLPGITQINTIVVDDGSTDQTASIARQSGAITLRHTLNRGVGLARITGIRAARHLQVDLMVSMDSDGQHAMEDVPSVLAPILENRADIVIGTRMIDPKGMPLVRQIANRTMNRLIHLLSGVRVTDSQSGFVAYNRRALETLKLKSQGHEVCTEILVLAHRHRLRIAEVPIKVIYTAYSKQKGQRLSNAINILVRLAVQALRQ